MGVTVAAIATPLGAAGIGVIRLSGDTALAVADRVFVSVREGKTLAKTPGYTARYGHVRDGAEILDDAVALVFRSPHSYTGEDVVELSCHGGVYLLQRVLRACLTAGAEPAPPGEFTRRAFLHGKMDLSQAEAVMALIGADGERGLRTALATREGAVFRRMEAIKAELLVVNAAFSAYVDYPDEDIPALSRETLTDTLQRVETALTQLLSTFDAGRVLREGVATVIAGAPNVGKSTLMNALAGYERSIVTEIPGTTRDVVEETVRLGEVTLRLADTAGLRETEDRVEQRGVALADRRLRTAELVLAVFDGSRPLSPEDCRFAEQVADRPCVAIINKEDTVQKINYSYIAERFPYTVTLSAQTGEGLDALAQAVAAVTGVRGLDAAQPVLATERQRACAARCLERVREAQQALSTGLTLDAVSVSVDGALEAVLSLTGERVSEAVVQEIFSRFCVGK